MSEKLERLAEEAVECIAEKAENCGKKLGNKIVNVLDSGVNLINAAC